MDVMPREVVQKHLHKIAEKHLGTKQYTTDISRGTEKGDNYIGIIYRAKFCTNCENGNNNTESNVCKCLELIVKVPPDNKIRREKFFARPAFLREAMAYDEVLPLFMEFQQSRGVIPTEGGFHHIAPKYGILTDELDEAIILKDLTSDGYEMYNRHNYITVDHANLVMTILGKLHAISFAMKDQCPEKFDKYTKIEELFKSRSSEDDFKAYMVMIKDRAISILDPEKYQTYIDKLNKIFENENLLSLTINLTSGEEAEPYAVVAHGDCWNNNVLYKYKDGKVTHARLIDWQIMRYASPVCDLMYFLFLATSREIRKTHYKGFLDTYYNSLSAFLTRLGSNPNEVFPRKAFDDQLIKFGKFGFVMGCMLIPILTTHSEDIPDLDEMSEMLDNKEVMEDKFKSLKSEDAYKERMHGLILDMFELGYL